jgi:AhpD family alkylhydroperoxidase
MLCGGDDYMLWIRFDFEQDQCCYNLAMRRKFHRRIYTRPGEFFQDFRYMMSHRALIRRAMNDLIPFDFRERLMMIVTEVNGCRYCSTFHSRLALTSGVSDKELRELLAGSIPKDAPPEELPALLYTQYWAERNAQPDTEAEKRLREVYGDEKAEAIQVILRMIRAGNLLGNLADFLLHRFTFGRLGLRDDEARFAAS